MAVTRDPAVILEYRIEYYTPRAETWPVVKTYPRLPVTWEVFLLFWR